MLPRQPRLPNDIAVQRRAREGARRATDAPVRLQRRVRRHPRRLPPEDAGGISLNFSQKLEEIAPILHSLVRVPPQISVRPEQGPRAALSVVPELRDDELNGAVPLRVVRPTLEQLDIRSNESKVLGQLVANLKRHLLAVAAKGSRRSFLFEFRYRHVARACASNDTGVQRRTREGAQRPTRPSVCNAGLGGTQLGPDENAAYTGADLRRGETVENQG